MREQEKWNQHFHPRKAKARKGRVPKGSVRHEIAQPTSAAQHFPSELATQRSISPRDESSVVWFCVREQKICIIRFCYLIILKGSPLCFRQVFAWLLGFHGVNLSLKIFFYPRGSERYHEVQCTELSKWNYMLQHLTLQSTQQRLRVDKVPECIIAASGDYRRKHEGKWGFVCISRERH